MSHWLSGGLGFMLDHVENSLDRFFNLPLNEKIEFDTDVLLRTDFLTRVDGYTKAIQHGLMAPNEGRARFGGLKPVEHGDQPLVQQQMVNLGYHETLAAQQNQPAPPVPQEEVEAAHNANVYQLKKAIHG